MDEIYRVVREHVYTYPQTLIAYLFVCLMFGLLCSSITTHKSGGPGAGFVIGFLLWIVGWMFCLLIPYKPVEFIQNHNERRRRFHVSQAIGQRSRVRGKERDDLLAKLDERIK